MSIRRSDSSISIGASSGRSGAIDDLRESRVPPVGGVERREPYEAMDSALGLQRAVCVLALDGDRRRLQAGLLSRARLDRLGLEATIGGPAQVHAQEHLRPVLSVRAPGSRVDLEHRIASVVLAVEERVLLQASEFGLERGDQLRDLVLVFAELEQLARVRVLALQALVALELAGKTCVLGGDARRTGLVVPEPGSSHRLLELCPGAGLGGRGQR